jgi:CubicO group peptidase (beta-lactamase class C family)
MPDWTAARDVADALVARWDGAPGGAVVLFDAEGVRGTAAGGWASTEHAIPFTPGTATRLASISKHMLATCLLTEGVPLDRALPGVPHLPPVPLARALDMTGGLPDLMEVLWQRGVPFTATLARDELEAVCAGFCAACGPPGAEMAYSNTGWRLGQVALEHATGLAYATVLRRRMEAAGAAIRFPSDETEPVRGLASGYWHDGAGWRRGRYGLNYSASGGMAGSALDLARWAGALLGGTAGLGAVLDGLLAPRHFADGAPSAYRLGLVATTLGGVAVAAHGGSLPGYRSHLLMAPGAGVGVALVTNREEDPLPPAIAIMAALLGVEPPAPASGLPAGLYAAPDGPAWAELHDDAVEFMGARETLFGPPHALRSFPGALEIDAAVLAGSLRGRFGGVARVLDRVPPGLPLDPALVGTWSGTDGRRLVVAADGTARFPWVDGRGVATRLTPLPGPRAIASLLHGPWRHRPCLVLEPDGRLLLASHRARVERLSRAA